MKSAFPGDLWSLSSLENGEAIGGTGSNVARVYLESARRIGIDDRREHGEALCIYQRVLFERSIAGGLGFAVDVGYIC